MKNSTGGNGKQNHSSHGCLGTEEKRTTPEEAKSDSAAEEGGYGRRSQRVEIAQLYCAEEKMPAENGGTHKGPKKTPFQTNNIAIKNNRPRKEGGKKIGIKKALNKKAGNYDQPNQKINKEFRETGQIGGKEQKTPPLAGRRN